MSSFFQDILAVLVLYNEKLENSNTFKSLTNAVPQGNYLDLVVYDNSAEQMKQPNFKAKGFNIHYIHNVMNPGVSAAYNFGANFAKDKNKTWLLILDQDTVLPQEIFDEYAKGIEEYPNISLFAPILKIKDGTILSPCKFKYFGRHLRSVDFGIQSLENNSPVNSGILVNLVSFGEAGGYNEKVPLDLSDHQFIERFRKKNTNYVIINTVGIQNFSAIEDNLDKQLIRFEYYCKGIFNFETNSSLKKDLMIFFLLLKTLKKSIRFGSYKFVHIYRNQRLTL